jgi:hypothetical protein
MKKLFTITLSLIMCLSCFALFGCSKAKGEWVLKAVEFGGSRYNLGEAFQGEILSENTIKLSLQDNDKAVLTTFGVSQTGTWKETRDDDEIKLSFDGGLIIYAEIDDAEMEFSVEGIEYILRKR